MIKVVVLGLGMKYIFRVILRTINIKMELQSFLELNLEIFFSFIYAQFHLVNYPFKFGKA